LLLFSAVVAAPILGSAWILPIWGFPLLALDLDGCGATCHSGGVLRLACLDLAAEVGAVAGLGVLLPGLFPCFAGACSGASEEPVGFLYRSGASSVAFFVVGEEGVVMLSVVLPSGHFFVVLTLCGLSLKTSRPHKVRLQITRSRHLRVGAAAAAAAARPQLMVEFVVGWFRDLVIISSFHGVPCITEHL
jgi:hypothetical protein